MARRHTFYVAEMFALITEPDQNNLCAIMHEYLFRRLRLTYLLHSKPTTFKMQYLV